MWTCSLVLIVLVFSMSAQPVDYIRCRMDCATSCGRNTTTTCANCVMGYDCTSATDQVCLPKNWTATACPSSCAAFSPKTSCGVGCVAIDSCGGDTEHLCVPNNGPRSPCSVNQTCLRWRACDKNTTSGAQCCPDGQNCLPDNTYKDCGDCNVVEQKYLEAVCHLEKFLPLWQWLLIAGAGLVLVIGLIVGICCCRKGKGPQRIEDEEWLMDDSNNAMWS